jgi:serine-type D-Ala-D-Ala carboxypeptidase/endopeptidase (penicillin-binding protein 4)
MATVAVMTLISSAGTVFAQRGTLQEEVRSLIQSKKLDGARVGVMLMDAKSKSTLAAVRDDDAFIPASNMKLLTSGAAMMILGSDFSFRTELVLSGKTLIVKGDGDPALADPEVLRLSDTKMTVDDVLATLATSVTKAGLTSIEGIVVDDRVFDRTYVHSTWNKENLHLPYSAQIAGLNFHANVLSVFPRPNPAGAGSPPLFETQPSAAWMRIESSKAKTVKQGNNSVWLIRDAGDLNNFAMRGEVRTPSRSPISVTVNNPPLWFGQLLASSLIKNGITIADQRLMPGGVPVGVRLATADDRFETSQVLAVVNTPIGEVLERCNTDSENLYAESLLKRMGNKVTGEPGSWTNGAAVLRMMLSQELSPQAASSTIIVDGSGLSRENRVTPATIATWLSTITEKPWSQEFIHSLAQPGEGTLEHRFQNTKLASKVYAKSGYIKGVRSLSGYVTSEDESDILVFSILINDLPQGGFEASHAAAKDLHEEIVKLLDRTIARRTANREAKVGG